MVFADFTEIKHHQTFIQARYEALLKEDDADTSKNENTESSLDLYLAKDLDAALDSFDNLFCRRCLVSISFVFLLHFVYQTPHYMLYRIFYSRWCFLYYFYLLIICSPHFAHTGRSLIVDYMDVHRILFFLYVIGLPTDVSLPWNCVYSKWDAYDVFLH